jgi:hypothetical protein
MHHKPRKQGKEGQTPKQATPHLKNNKAFKWLKIND